MLISGADVRMKASLGLRLAGFYCVMIWHEPRCLARQQHCKEPAWYNIPLPVAWEDCQEDRQTRYGYPSSGFHICNIWHTST